MYKQLKIGCIILVLLISMLPHGISNSNFSSSDARDQSINDVISSDTVIIHNPYNKVDFQTVHHYKANLHTHTTQSDGSSDPDDVIMHYHDIGKYDILAITDHNKNTWPWTGWITDIPTMESDSSAFFPSLNMLAISGNELSIGHHRGSVLNGYNGGGALIDKTFQRIQKNNGLSLFYHPGRYSYDVEWYQDYFDNFPDMILGIEIYNQGDRYENDRLLWDEINKDRHPSDLIWGFSNDDLHRINDHAFRNYQHILMDELTETAFRQALMDGAFYSSYEPDGADQTGPTYGVAMTPMLTDVIIDKDVIQIEGISVDSIEWYDENSEVVSSTYWINVSNVQSNFVRAVLSNEHGRTYSQPFGLERIDLTSLPSSFSWRDIDGIDFTTPIRDQSPFGSCETFAITAAVETMVQKEVGFPFNCDLSEAHLYFYSRGNFDWGSYPENNTEFLVNYGIPDEACWPYPTEYRMYPLNTTADNWMNRTVRIHDWWYLPEDVNAIKYALITNGPVPTYFQVFRDFLKYEEGVYRHRWGECFGIHYVCIVGWNDDPGYWIVKNSWGTEYQDEGWFNIAYGECSIEKKSFYLDGVYGQYPIVFVDDDNTIGPWDGSKTHPYFSIQQGIDAVYDGWCVYVKNGEYHEHVVINKSIHLIGENAYQTIIDGDGHGQVIVISSPEVTVSDFTIQQSGVQPFEAGIKTLSLHSNATITNNIFQNNGIGLFLNYAYSEDYGKSSFNIIRDNIFKDNLQGMYVHWSDNNEIVGNVFKDNRDYGLELEASRHGFISNNLFARNGQIGLYLRAKSENNRITGNDFMENEVDAFVDGSFRNSWRGNYWDDSSYFMMKFIKARLLVYDLPFFVVDLFSSQQRNTGLA